VSRALGAFSQLDILVNNAAARNVPRLRTPARPNGKRWSASTLGAANCAGRRCRRCWGTRASIVNVSSCYAVTGRKGMGIYDATKAGVLAMTRTLAFEEAAHGVRVNAVCPGSTLTSFHIAKARAAGKSVELLKTERQTTSLLSRWAMPHEVAWPIIWLASDEASFMTGATLMVDGGLSIM
jgi:meso-butanediol dehydrogenase/(S,S)-butanediol dehydrogenase/diacetyl reductase